MSLEQIVKEKLDQAGAILREKHIDAWITFVRETPLMRDPTLSLIVSPSLHMTWHSAFILTRNDERIAIVGRFDRENIAQLGTYGEIITYDQKFSEPLREALARLDPKSIALNYSDSDPGADGLSHGMWLALNNALKGTPYADRLISAEEVIGALRGRKTASEVALIKEAIADTLHIFDEVTHFLEPGLSARGIADIMHDKLSEMGLTTAWDDEYCPVVTPGPEAPVGHAAPGDFKTQRGHVLQIDFGVTKNHYVSDIQRTWYFLKEGERHPPEEVQRAFNAVRNAILAAAEALRPGALGWEVDRAARSSLIAAGYPEYMHATGHHIGQTVHDGATVLGPRWERYGQSAYGRVDAGNVFTLELGVALPQRGYIGLEEDVLVTPSGIEWLSDPQEELICV
jgi:Xaa-Pro aminopeptidase